MAGAHPESVMITGAGRGLGLGFVREFLKLPGVQHCFATVRDKSRATELNALASSDARLTIVEMDVQKDDTIARAFDQIKTCVGDGGLSLLIHNAGVLINYPIEEPSDRGRLREILDINTVAPLVITQKFLPLLRCAADRVKKHNPSFGCARSAVIFINSATGSLADNKMGSRIGEFHTIGSRMSKAAQNQVMRTLAVDLRPDGILCCSLVPGWVKTDMGGDGAITTVEEACTEMVATMLKIDESHTGAYLRRNGQQFPF
ncbi:unnamed protein product, partial [Mesorhabditis spiculigera]